MVPLTRPANPLRFDAVAGDAETAVRLPPPVSRDGSDEQRPHTRFRHSEQLTSPFPPPAGSDVRTPGRAPDKRDVVVCPVCHRSAPGDAQRCHYCLAELSTLEPLDEAQTTVYLEEERDAMARAARRKRTIRWIRALGALLVVFFIARWAYLEYIYVLPVLEQPASTARSLVLTPDSWPAANGDLGGRRSADAGAHIDAAVAWRSTPGATVETAIVSDAERIYMSLADGNLVALAIEDGSEVWRRPYEQFLLAAPTLAGGMLYAAGRDGLIQALDAATGELLWEARAGDVLVTSPLVYEGTVYLFAFGEWFGFDADSGELLWRRDIDTDWSLVDRQFVTPVLDDDYVAVATSDRVLVFDRRTGGATYWFGMISFPQALALDDGTLYAISHRLYASIETDSQRPWWDGIRGAWVQLDFWGMAPAAPPPPRNWVRANPPREYFSPAVGAERLYVAGARGDVVAYGFSDGWPVWELDVGFVTAPPTLTRDGLLVAANRVLLLLDPASGDEIGRRDFDAPIRSVTVTAHGTYIAIDGGIVIALR